MLLSRLRVIEGSSGKETKWNVCNNVDFVLDVRIWNANFFLKNLVKLARIVKSSPSLVIQVKFSLSKI